MNEFTREKTITIREIVPERDQLPTCAAWLFTSLDQCPNKARYMVYDTQQSGEMPVCGVHAGRPGLLWHPRARRSG